MDWWLTALTRRGYDCWNLGDVDDTQREDLIMRARTLVDLPVADAVSLHYGQPHERLLARYTVRDRRELDGVDPAAVTAYRARVDEATSSARRDAARAALLSCTSEERALVIGEIPPPPRTTSGGRDA